MVGDRPIGAGRERSTHPPALLAAGSGGGMGAVRALARRRLHSRTASGIGDRVQGLAGRPRQRISRVRAGRCPAGRAALCRAAERP